MNDQTIPLKWVEYKGGMAILHNDKPLLKADKSGWWGTYIHGYLVRQGRRNNLEEAQAEAVKEYNGYFANLPGIGDETT